MNTNLNFINNYIARSKWNYQFTRAFSLRLIGEYNGNIANSGFYVFAEREKLQR